MGGAGRERGERGRERSGACAHLLAQQAAELVCLLVVAWRRVEKLARLGRLHLVRQDALSSHTAA